MKIKEKGKACIDYLKKLRLRRPRQTVFIIIYLACAILLSFFVSKGNYKNNHVLLNNVSFTQDGTDYVSSSFSFPASTHYITISYFAQNPGEIVVRDGNYVLARSNYEASQGEANQVTSILFSVPRDTSDYRIYFSNPEGGQVLVYSIDFLSDKPLNNDHIAKAILFFLVFMYVLVMILLIHNEVISKEKIVSITFVTAFVIFASLPLMFDYIVAGHDLWTQCSRIEGMQEALSDGQIFPIIYPNTNNGYGYLGFVYPELFLYLPALLRKSGVSMVMSYHIFLFVINILTAIICYFSVHSVLESLKINKESDEKVRSITICCTVIYLLAPYRLTDMYIRSALGEVLAMTFLPLCFAGIYHLYAGNRKRWYYIALGMTGLMQSHILSVVMVIPLTVLMCIPFAKDIAKNKRWREIINAFVMFLCLNLWYIIPFVRYYFLPLNTESMQVDDLSYHSVPLGQLFSVNTGYRDEDILVLTLGVSGLVVFIITSIFLFEKSHDIKSNEERSVRFVLMTTICCVVYVLFASEITPWDYLSDTSVFVGEVFKTLQFPFRLLSVVTICMIFMLGIALLKSENLGKYLVPAVLAIIVLAVLDSSTLMDRYEAGYKSITSYSGGFNLHVPEDYLPKGTDVAMFSDTEAHINEGEIEDYEKFGTTVIFSYRAESETVATVPLLYYQCYHATDEAGRYLPVFAAEDKRLAVSLPSGSHNVKIRIRYW